MTTQRRSRTAPFFTVFSLVTLVSAAYAQSSPKPKPSPSASAAGRSVTLTFARPGTYDYWAVGKTGAGPVQTATVGAKSATMTLPPDAVAIDVLANDSGLVATFDATRLEAPSETVSPNDFTRLRTVKVAVTAGGKPVEKAQVTLTDAMGKSSAQALTADDAGIASFNDVPLGKATIAAVYGAGSAKTSSDITLAPAKGGGPVTVPLSLNGDVPTLSPSAGASANLPVAPAPENPSKAVTPPGSAGNAWVPGIFGLMLLVIALYYGMRTAKRRGVTVESALKRIGVETPANMVAASAVGVKPVPAPLPPLPALSDLPAAGPAPTVAANFAVASVAATGPARLQGIAGSVVGETFDLDTTEPLTIGRDVENGLALSQDTAISRRHARVVKFGNDWQVVDTGSSNGTFVNGVRLVGDDGRLLQAGDEIQIGGARFRFEGA